MSEQPKGLSGTALKVLATTSPLGEQAAAFIRWLNTERGEMGSRLERMERALRDQHREIERLQRRVAELESGNA